MNSIRRHTLSVVFKLPYEYGAILLTRNLNVEIGTDPMTSAQMARTSALLSAPWLLGVATQMSGKHARADAIRVDCRVDALAEVTCRCLDRSQWHCGPRRWWWAL